MPHTYVSELVHCVFSTKERRKLIRAETQSELWSFIGGIARKNSFKALIVGGTENHVHILLSLPATVPLAKAMQLMKGASSRWMNENHTKGSSWQEGYGAFTLGVSQKPRTIDYIKRQAEHHQKRSFEEEFVAFLKKHDRLRSEIRVGIGFRHPAGTRIILPVTPALKRRATIRRPSGTPTLSAS